MTDPQYEAAKNRIEHLEQMFHTGAAGKKTNAAVQNQLSFAYDLLEDGRYGDLESLCQELEMYELAQSADLEPTSVEQFSPQQELGAEAKEAVAHSDEASPLSFSPLDDRISVEEMASDAGANTDDSATHALEEHVRRALTKGLTKRIQKNGDAGAGRSHSFAPIEKIEQFAQQVNEAVTQTVNRQLAEVDRAAELQDAESIHPETQSAALDKKPEIQTDHIRSDVQQQLGTERLQRIVREVVSELQEKAASSEEEQAAVRDIPQEPALPEPMNEHYTQLAQRVDELHNAMNTIVESIATLQESVVEAVAQGSVQAATETVQKAEQTTEDVAPAQEVAANENVEVLSKQAEHRTEERQDEQSQDAAEDPQGEIDDELMDDIVGFLEEELIDYLQDEGFVTEAYQKKVAEEESLLSEESEHVQDTVEELAKASVEILDFDSDGGSEEPLVEEVSSENEVAEAVVSELKPESAQEPEAQRQSTADEDEKVEATVEEPVMSGEELSQEDIDAMISGASEVDEEISDIQAVVDDGPLDQNAIDALLGNAEESAPAVVSEPEAVVDDGPLDQAAIDALLGGTEEPAIVADDGPLDQNAIDALLSGAEEPTPAAAPEPVAVADDGPLDQSAIDALLSGAEEPTPAAAPEPAAVADDGPLDQAAIDALLGNAEVSAVAADDGPLDQDAIDSLLTGTNSYRETDREEQASHPTIDVADMQAAAAAQAKSVINEVEEQLVKDVPVVEDLDQIDINQAIAAAPEVIEQVEKELDNGKLGSDQARSSSGRLSLQDISAKSPGAVDGMETNAIIRDAMMRGESAVEGEWAEGSHSFQGLTDNDGLADSVEIQEQSALSDKHLASKPTPVSEPADIEKMVEAAVSQQFTAMARGDVPPMAVPLSQMVTQVTQGAPSPLGHEQLKESFRIMLPELLKDEDIKQQLFAAMAIEMITNPGILSALSGVRSFVRQEIRAALEEQSNVL